jgi:sirohydrochlorin ferrochelatase
MTVPALLLVAHGTRDPAGAVTAEALACAVARRLPGVPVSLAFADVRGPSVTDVLAEGNGTGPAVVVPAFLSAGYHVRVDLPGQIERAGRAGVRLARPLGTTVVGAAVDRLVSAGWRASDAVVLAAAGSSDPRALADIRRAAVRLSGIIRQPVDVGYIATGRPGVNEVVARLRRAGSRVAVASWLLAPGLFHQWLCRSGADLVSDPIGVHPLLVDQLVRRYLGQSNRPGSPAFAAAASDHR